MLTETYSVITMMIEQKSTHRMLSKLEKNIENMSKSEHKDFDCRYMKTILNEFIQFDNYLQSRKVEVYVIPAIRKVTEQFDSLIAELESLSSQAMNLIRYMYEQIRFAIDGGEFETEILFSSMEFYCQNLLKRLAKEEEQLFPAVRNLLSCEEWFSIAVQCMSRDGKNKPHPG